MFRALPTVAARARVPTMAPRLVPIRHMQFDNDKKILSDKEQQGGRRKQELDAEEMGMTLFSRDPIMPPVGAGSKENPIEVPSGYEERVVGYECPEAHQLMWFTLTKGPLHYIPSIDKYFKLIAV